MKLFEKIKQNYSAVQNEWTVEEYLEMCSKDKMYYASAAERLLKAIGEPEIIDTRHDPVLSRIFSNKKIKRYPAFSEFYGMEETIEQIVSFFKHASQGLEEKKQILYLMGPVGGGKSSLAEKVKSLMQEFPIYVLKAGDELSPVFESPLGLFSDHKDMLETEFGVQKRYVPKCMSPWAHKRLQEFGGEIGKFSVVKMYPSEQEQISISKTEPGDDNNQDISTLVGKVDIRKLAEFEQNDPDAYSYTGGLCLGNQGVMEFVEMFKAPIKVLNPLLTATQEKNFKGTEPIGAIPFDGVILAHSNESEWEKFTNDKKNEAFLDRIYKVSVPYCLRIDEEKKIYEKLIRESYLKEAPCAPKTLDMLAQFSVLSRLIVPENSSVYSKMRVYNGESLKNTDPTAKSLQEYKQEAGINEGMTGISTRFAFKVLSRVFNYDDDEVAANPVHLLYVLEKEVVKMQLNKEIESRYLNFIKSVLASKYVDFIADEIQKAYIESYQTYGQNIFEKYVIYADNWMQGNDYRDPESGEMLDRGVLNAELEKIEKPAGIANPKDFRGEVTNYVLRYRANNGGETPTWDSYHKIKNVIEKKIFANTEDLLPVISFTAKSNVEDESKHKDFVKRMNDRGYTNKQIRILVDWFMRVRKTMA
ncbi:PrkA family serine protein kinase [Aureibacter tunicatorum]|uniref:Serine protein kinase n=1 Tax=Aureibacter tunicatorum TaxID=866807 RepID=A0AAE4BSI3_9BACT|nr:PrkA family serine protein kinase [Aureibacter tunicatorum]MDR6238870.1 serine protein kinase [Aureibacter tunicatorum]BDD05203.1 PrkA family serine protein kinase [Aureibacter tunicatorum]